MYADGSAGREPAGAGVREEGIHAVVIGKAMEGNDRVLLNEDERRFLEPPKTDELYKVV